MIRLIVGWFAGLLTGLFYADAFKRPDLTGPHLYDREKDEW